MSDRQNWSRLVAAIFALTLVSAFAFATIAPRSFTSLFTAEAQVAPATESAAAPADDPEGGPACTTAGPIEVQSSGGTTTPTAYANLGAGFAAINAGTHQGIISIEVCASTNEGTTPATLHSSGAGPATYASVSIVPLGDALTISGNPVTGFGVIQLNGADNVTINGDNPNSAGTNRNLTVSNTTTSTVIANSAVRIATSASAASADNNTIKNLILLGNVTGGNAAAITSTTGSSNSSFGIYIGGNGGATATTEPTAITSVTAQTAPAGTTVNNLMIDNNVVNQAARAIVFNGGAASVSNGVTISNNLIGDQGTATPATPPYTAPATTVYTKGIWVAGTSSVVVTGNSLKNILSYVGTTMTAIEILTPAVTNSVVTNNTVNTLANNGPTSIAKAILISSTTAAYTIAGNTVTNVQTFAGASGTAGIEVTAAATSGTIERNKVQTVYGRSTGTFGAYGINLTAGTGIVLKNNFVSDINMDMTGGAAFSTQFSVHGIRIAGGTNHKVYHNTVNLFGALLGTPTTSIMTSALEVTVIGVTGLDIRNNILSNTMTGGTTSIAHVSMFLPPLATSAMNLTLNNNDYFSGPDAARQGIGQVGVTAGAGFYLASNFNAGATTPATNLRAYTSTLSAAGTNDNASKVVDPLLVSNTDLHIQSASSMESMGVSVGVTDDIDGQVRPNGPVPDIGADEIPLPLAPGALQFSGGAFSGSEGNMATMTVNRSGGSLGSVTVDYATVAGGTATGGASCGGSVDYVNASGTLTFPDGVTSQTFMVQLCSDAAIEGTETVNMQLSNATGGATIGAQSTAVLSITDVVIFTGPIDVGSGQTFTSLTNPGGVFESLNGGIVTGNVVINLTSDLTTETGAVFLNQLNEQGGGAGTYTVTIKPSAAPRVISGTSAGALIRINGADRVTIDGSTSGGSDRSLTITNNSTATNTAAIHISSLGAGAGSTNVTIKNANLSCGSDQSLNTNVTYGISQGGALLGNSGADNDNNTFTNLAITKVNIGIYSSGENAANQVQGTAITNNLIGPAAFGADQIGRAGIIFNLTNGATVTGNEVRFVGVLEPQTSSGGSYDKFGISHAFNGWSDTTSGDLAVSNTLTARNRVHDIVEENTFSAVGIFMAGGNGANDTLNTTVNNFIWNVRADGTSGDNSVSLGIASGKGDVVAYNTIYSAGDLDPGVSATASQSSFGLQITSTTAVNLTLKDNIVFTDMTSNTATLKHGSIKIPASFAWGTGGSNFNDLYVPAANTQAIVGRVNLTDALTLADWQTATTQDANSKSVDPLFVSATDLHIQGTSTLIAMGNPVVGVTTDIDGDPRDASTPEIGADELFTAVPGTLAFSSATYSVGEAGPTATLTVNRTGGSDGAVNVDYALSGGTASGGAACGAGVDYVNAGGTLMFANGETTKNIVVAVCEDSVFEGDETFNATLSNATGGATIGAPNPAAVTITENEGVPTVQFSSATYTTAEGVTDSASGIGVTINVTLSGASQGITSVAYATVAGGTATGGATCAAGVDYFNTSGTLNIPPGMLGGSFFVETCVDAIDEPDETFNIALSAPVGATLGTPNAAVVTITDNDLPAGPITVTATAGTPGPTSYTTLKDAVDAINAGTHQGAIVVSVNSNTTETATSVLNSSGAGTASYTSILIQPTADGLTIAGASVIGRGLIELNGADNVTIDGDNPNSAGINRNLTIQNTAANTVTFTSVIRIALAISVVNTADNDTFKNLNIVGSATGRNVAAANTTTGSENTTFGILAGTGASTTTATAAPAAIVSVSTGVAAGGTANNLTISNNNIVTAARAVSINGTATSVFPGLLINTNSIGNAVAGNADQVTAMGIVASGSTNAVIAANTVYVEGWVPASASTHGIDVGINSTAISGTTIEKNGVNRVKHNNPGTWTAIGINLGGGNNHAVRNNFVSGILNDQVAGTGAFGTTFGAYGIRIGSGTGHTVYHNSVHLYGAMGGVVSTNLTAAFLMSATTQTGVDVRNNIFSNQVTGGNPATPGTRNVAIALPSGGTSAMNLTLNNNAYFVSSDALSRMAQVGVTFGVGEYQAADFDPTSTTPATNFRAYSSTLSAAGTNDNASFATATAPPFTSNTNLHIPAATATRLESGGAAVGVLDDIDLETRAATPDIGADEFAGSPAPANDIGASGFINPVPGSNVPTGAVFTPQARFVNNGTAPQTNVPVRFRIVNSSMVEVYNQTAMISSIAPLQQVTVSFPATSVAAAGAYTMFASSELAGDSNPGNDSINAGFTAVTPIAGTINVGAGETYTSLTNAGGLFAALNAAGISGSVTVNITTDLTGETGAVALNQLAEAGSGGYTVTIKPSGAARTISGTSAASSGLIILSGADRIIFDGSLSGGTDRSLTITNNQATTGIVIWMRSPSASNGATNNTIKNCIINGAPGPNSTTVAGILTGSSVTLGGDAESPNSNNIVQNNWIYRVQNALYLRGGLTAPVFDQNWTVTGNELGSTVAADKNIFRGMLIGNAANFTISGNTVHGIQSTTTTTAAMSGIQLGLLLSNGTVTNNQISDIKNVSATGTGAYGISVIATSTASNVTIANNFVSDIAANGSATVASNGHGIGFTSLAPGGSGYNLYFNSVNLNTNQTTAQTSAAMFIAATFNVAGAINARNNIFSNSETTGTRYGVYSLAPASVFSPIDYNDYFAQNVGFIGGSARVALADWQTGTGQDANSKSVDPLFVSSTDLHIQAASTLINMGVAGTGITTDIDGQARDATPDIGADEIAAVAMPGSLQFSSATYSVGEAGGTATLTVTRTGGSDGTVTVNFATVAGGTATGGASCSAGVDYIDTIGGLTFLNGETSKLLSVPICNDTAVEPSETVNVGLSSPTGGATIGTPSTAVVTINDDDLPAGTLSISDVRMLEGNSGAKNFVFTVTYSGSAAPASVQYATANGTATSGVDYLAASGTLNFPVTLSPEGVIVPQTATITVVVGSDVTKEATEVFFVNLSNPVGATITDGQGLGIIVDDDKATVADFDLDHMSDISVFRPSEGRWYILQSASLTPKIVTFGQVGDIAVPGDYDGDGISDVAIWRSSDTSWYRILSSTGTTVIDSWGTAGDKPVQGDYDGDGKTDLAVFRPSTGTWWILRSSNGTSSSIPFGISTDRLVQGDYDGDAKTDVAVYRDGTWYVVRSSDSVVQIANFGLASDKPISGDFDGDGKYDLAIYRNGEWWVLRSLTGTATAVPWGTGTDIPVPADYDSDGTTDLAVFRPSTGNWFIIRSSNSSAFGLHWGESGDVPIPAAYIPQ